MRMKARNKSSSSPKFWENFSSPIAVAHRGGDAAGVEKENSLAAFRAAYKLGYRWFETDVVATKDNKLVAIHGRGWQLHPRKNMPLRSSIRKQTYAEVKKKIVVGGEEILLFEDILDQFPNVKIFVDPKTFKSVPMLVEVLSRRPTDIDRVCVGAFSKIRTIRVAQLVKMATGRELTTCILGPLNAYPIYIAARLKFLRPAVKYYVQETNAGSIHIPYRWVTNSPKAGRKLLNYAHTLGLKVAVYTPNSERTIRVSLGGGVDIVISDKAELLMDLIKTKHKK
jgi:glycerophosphoryl diester phosphodiesterase